MLAHLAPPLRGLQLQPLPGLLLAVGRSAAAVVAAVAGGRVEAGLEQLPPLPQLRIPTRTPGSAGPEGLGSPGGHPSQKARPAPRPLGRPHSACSNARRRATGQAPEWGDHGSPRGWAACPPRPAEPDGPAKAVSCYLSSSKRAEIVLSVGPFSFFASACAIW